MSEHQIKIESSLGHDIISLDVPFEMLRAWLRYEKYVTKKDVIDLVGRIRITADYIERQMKKAGFDYMDKVIE